MALVDHGHLPTTNDLEFIGMVEDGDDLIFNTLFSNAGSDPSSPTSSEGGPHDDGEGKGHPTFVTPTHRKGRRHWWHR